MLDQAEEFFKKSLKTNPLDWRTYIGLGETYLRRSSMELAETTFQSALPHATDGGMTAHVCRMLGRICVCKEDYNGAVAALAMAVKADPKCALALYDYAQYLACVGDKDRSLSALVAAIELSPDIWNLAIGEALFSRQQQATRQTLVRLRDSLVVEAQRLFAECSRASDEARRAVQELRDVAYRARSQAPGLQSDNVLREMEALLGRLPSDEASYTRMRYAQLRDVVPRLRTIINGLGSALASAKHQVGAERNSFFKAVGSGTGAGVAVFCMMFVVAYIAATIVLSVAGCMYHYNSIHRVDFSWSQYASPVALVFALYFGLTVAAEGVSRR